MHHYCDELLWLRLAQAIDRGTSSEEELDELEAAARSRADLAPHVDQLRQEKQSGEGQHHLTAIVTVQADAGDGTTFFRKEVKEEACDFDGQEETGSCVAFGGLANYLESGGYTHAVTRGHNPYTDLSRDAAVRHALLRLAYDLVRDKVTGRVVAVMWGPMERSDPLLEGAALVAHEEVAAHAHRQVALEGRRSLPLTPRSSPPPPSPSPPPVTRLQPSEGEGRPSLPLTPRSSPPHPPPSLSPPPVTPSRRTVMEG